MLSNGKEKRYAMRFISFFMMILFMMSLVIGCSSTPKEVEQEKVETVANPVQEKVETVANPVQEETRTALSAPIENTNNIQENIINIATENPVMIEQNVPVISVAENKTAEQLHFLYWGAWEGQFLPIANANGKQLGSLSSLSSFIQSKITPNTLVLSSGNLFSGADNDTQPIVEALNLLHLRALTLENLELNYKVKELKKRLEKARFDLLSANIYSGNERAFAPYIIERMGNIRVGIIGITSEDVVIQASPTVLENLQFRNPSQEIEACYKEISSKIDFLVVLSNMRYAEDIELAKNHPYINLILGRYEVAPQPTFQRVGNVAIARINQKMGVQMGEIYAERSGDTWTVSDTTLYEIGPDGKDCQNLPLVEEVEKLVQDWREKEKYLDEVLCTTAVALDGEYQHIRQQETNLGNFMTDILLDQCADSDIAFLNSGMFRASVASGKFTRRMLQTVIPYKNIIVELSVTGEMLRDVLETSVSQYEKISGAFLQVAGLSFTFDPTQEPFNRVSEVSILGEPLELDKNYNVVTCKYLADGGDDYVMLKNATVIKTLKSSMIELVEDYCKSHSEINPMLENRIIKKAD